jgi:hypothetical protein
MKSTLSVSQLIWVHQLKADEAEIDPVVYSTAAEYFNLSSYPISSVNLLSGSTYIHHLAELARQKSSVNETDTDTEQEPEFTKWSLVVQDCFSGGSVPGEMFTLEFWQDLSELVERDGIVAMVWSTILALADNRILSG